MEIKLRFLHAFLVHDFEWKEFKALCLDNDKARERENIHIVCGLSRIIAVAAIHLCCVHSGRVIGDNARGAVCGCGLRGGGRQRRDTAQRYRYEVTGGNWRLDTG